MINGLKLKVSSKELSEHCTKRAVYHKEKAEEYNKQIPALEESVKAMESALGVSEGAEEVSHMNKSGYQQSSALSNLRSGVNNTLDKVREHRNKALVFEFFSTHFFTEDYDLSEHDLQRLEITKADW